MQVSFENGMNCTGNRRRSSLCSITLIEQAVGQRTMCRGQHIQFAFFFSQVRMRLSTVRLRETDINEWQLFYHSAALRLLDSKGWNSSSQEPLSFFTFIALYTIHQLDLSVVLCCRQLKGRCLLSPQRPSICLIASLLQLPIQLIFQS